MDPNQGTASAQYIAEQKLGTKVADHLEER